MNKNTFKAQALAMVMVVLVVASIIGVSLFSRMSKEKQSSVNEQDSSVSSSLVDGTLDFFVGADINKVESVLNDDSLTVKGGTFDSIKGVAQYLGQPNIDIVKDIDPDLFQVSPDEELCQGDNFIKVDLSYSDTEDFVEVQPGSLMAYNLKDAVILNSCELNVRMKAMNEVAVFIVKRVMVSDADVVTESVENYCINQNVSSECDMITVDDVHDFGGLDDSEPDAQSIWSTTNVDSDANARLLTFYLDDERTNKVAEIRILPLKGVLAVNNSQSREDCVADGRQFRSIRVTAEATCNDSYRGKQMFIPGSGNLGYSTLFDYGIYDTGLFQP